MLSPFSRAWVERCDKYLEIYGYPIPREEFVEEYMAVREKTFKSSTIRSAFRKSSSYP
ncbi:hypothetical protein BKA70DRAFT_1080273, partial [Coprinopsis sp. MPI-PUGE-AT-0042]